MRIAVNRGELKAMTAGLAKIIPAKTGVRALGFVRFSLLNGDLTAQATDLDQTAAFRFDCAEADGEGEMFVPFQTLRDLSKGAGEDGVTFESAGEPWRSAAPPRSRASTGR